MSKLFDWTPGYKKLPGMCACIDKFHVTNTSVSWGVKEILMHAGNGGKTGVGVGCQEAVSTRVDQKHVNSILLGHPRTIASSGNVVFNHVIRHIRWL